MIKFVLTKFTALFFLTALFFAACDLATTPESELSGSGYGTLEVRLHDAPGDFEEVNVFVERVEVKRQSTNGNDENDNGNSEENGEDNEENGDNNENGWIVISEPNQSYNLLELTNGVYEVLGQIELEAGYYNQIRLIVSNENNNVVVNGNEHAMFVPSGEQTGVKLNIQAEIENGSELVVMLDFDAKRSVVKRGIGNAPTPYLLKPVIRATLLDNVGSIAGTVLPVESRSIVYAVSGEDTVSTTFANLENGQFKLMGLEEGFYTVSVEPREEGYPETEREDVEVQVGHVTDLGEINLETENGEEEDENGEEENDDDENDEEDNGEDEDNDDS